jgi:5'(3')-deoxyribonucleotidase
MKIYIDLDQTLTDFDKQLSDLLGYLPKKELSPGIWNKINKAGKKFWSTMHWLEDSRKLWDNIKKHDPTILSSPSEHPSSIEGKKEWLKRELPGIPYIISSKKEKHADSESILIDDRENNIKKWKEAGGIGILHKNAEDTIKELDKILNEKKLHPFKEYY